MRFSYAESMIDPGYYSALASAAEDAGYDGFVIPDSICYPEESDSTYPYTPDGDRSFLEDRPFIEPFSLIPALAAVTERIRFATFVVKLPIRHPVLIAKQATSVAVLSGERFDFGVGSSPWPEDYEICDVQWARRGRRMDEMIEIIRGLSSGDYFEYKGEIFDVPSIKMTPTPEKPIPILLGGHSHAALARAARLGDGWMHAGGDPEALAAHIATLHTLRAEAGRSNEPFKLYVISMDAYSADGIKRLEDLGVTDVIVGFRDSYVPGPDTQPLSEKVDALRWYADEIISKVA
ncbi:MAG: TIGR03619 family F420-dependent LLM class oxidoreductase [Acidobacteria bacterium]|nr:TIGR03619 family F420-dependent LLM class oxidoreductase [Acidobacteriota bacterium]